MVNKTKLIRMRMRMIVVCLPLVSRAKLMRGEGRAEVKSGLHWMTSKAGESEQEQLALDGNPKWGLVHSLETNR